MLKKIFTKEVLASGVITFGVVVVAMVVTNKYIMPKINGGTVAQAKTPEAPAAE